VPRRGARANPPCPPPLPLEGAGLTPLDKDRARSMADEGGASAAAVEGEDPCETPALPTPINNVKKGTR